jgi:hypothetical protein
MKTVNGKRVPYTAEEFTVSLKQVLSLAGFDAKAFSIHSFRRGSATFASANGIPDEVIKDQGAWRSPCYKRYIALETQRREDFAAQMSQAVINALALP